MRLLSLCLQTLAKPEVIRLYNVDLEQLPLNLKKDVLHLLCKRGFIQETQVLSSLLCKSVIELDLSECFVTDEILDKISECADLRRLDLSLRRRQSRNISSQALCGLFKHLPHLQILAIPHCKEVNDSVLDSVAKHCNKLKELHIPNSSITDESLKVIGQHLVNLSVMNLLGTQITDDGIKNFVNGPAACNLTEINIDKCFNITVKSSLLIDKHCPNITIFTCGIYEETEESSQTMNRIRSKVKQIFWSI